MQINTRNEIDQTLTDLGRRTQNEFHRALIKVAARQRRGDSASSDLWSISLQTLERAIGNSIAEAVFQVRAISNTTIAFAMLESALITLMQDLGETLREWHQQRMTFPATPPGQSWMPDVRASLARQLDNYRPSFKDARPVAEKTEVGRKSKDWLNATNHVWGRLFRAELEPDSQVVIERALIAYFEDLDLEVGESTVRPYAKRMFEEVNRKA